MSQILLSRTVVRRRTLSLLSGAAALIVVAPGLAQAQSPVASTSHVATSPSLDDARATARTQTRAGKWSQAASAWREVLRRSVSDREAQTELTRALRHVESDPAFYEGLPRTLTSVAIESAPVVKTEVAAPVTRSVVAKVAPRVPASTSVTPFVVPSQNARAQNAEVAAPRAQTQLVQYVPAAANATMPALPPAPRASMPQPMGARPAQGTALSANRTLTPIAFKAPSPRRIRVSKVTAAKAWPFVNQASNALKAGNTTRALELYRKAYGIDPTNEYAAPGVGTSLIILGRFAEAAKTFRNHLAVAPGNIKTLRGLADSLTYSRQYREALGVNNTILQREPRNFDSLYQNAKIATYAGDYKLSETFFSRASGVKNNDPEFYATWGESLSYRRNARALNAFNRALELKNGYYPRATQGIADYYIYTSQFDKAIAPLKTVVTREPRNVEALISLGNALAYSQRPAEAVAPYRSALQLAPGNTQARLGLGRALVFSGRDAQGATELRRVLAVAPGNMEALEALAVAQNTTDPRGAIETYQTLLSRTPVPAKRAQLLASIGDLQLGNNDLNAATQSYATAAQLAPNNAEINLTYAQILGYADRYTDAGPIVERVLAVDANNPRALALQVQVAAKAGDSARASELANRLTTLTPATAEDALALADALRDAGNREAAQTLLARASSLSTDPVLSLRIANATRDAGDYAGAAVLYNRLLDTDAGNVAARVGLGRALFYQNQLDAAQQQADQVLLANANNDDALLLRAEVSLARGTDAGINDAAQAAGQLLGRDASNLGARNLAGQVLTARQQFADAITQFRSVVNADSNNLEARLGLARNLYYSREVDSSIEQYQEVIRRAPADTLPRLELAQIFLDRNRLGDAENLFNQVLTLQRGIAALPAARQAVERGQLVRLSPGARFGSPLRVTTRANAKVKPGARSLRNRVRLAQSASPTVGVGASGVAAPPAASFPQGPISSGAPTTTTETGDATPMAPDTQAPMMEMPSAQPPTTVTPAAPRVPVAPSVTFTTPLVPGASANTTVADQVTALNGLGEIRLRQNRYAEAVEFFDRGLQLDPNSAATRVGRARALRGQSNYTEALDEVGRALTADPNNLSGRVLRAQLLSDTGQPAQAQQELDALIQSLPEDAPLDTLLTLVEALNAQKNYASSLQLLDVSAQLYPREPAPLRLKAETLNFAGRYDESLTLYDQLIAADPQDGDAILGKARVYNYSNRLPEAESSYRQVLTVQPENYQAATELADVLGRRGNYTDAIQLYTLAIQGNPSDLATRVELARVQRYAGQPGEAEATLNQILDADARNVSALTERGVLRGTQGSYAPAIADLQNALAIAPNDQMALLGLAEVQGYAQNYPESIAGYRAVLATDPNNIKARTELGQVLSYAGQNAEALQELDAVLASNPTDLTAQLAKADVLGRTSRTNEAVGIYNTILTADPRNARARVGLADTYVIGRRYADAIKIYDQLISAEPGNTGYKINRARALGYNRQYAQASSALQSVIAAEPNNLQARLAFAEVGTNSGDARLRAGAVNQYRQILAADSTNVPARVGLGRVLSYQGNTGEAIRELNQVLTANSGNTEARVALAEAQRFGGRPFDARENYKQVLAVDPQNVGAKSGLAATKRATSTSIGVSGSYYNDSNGVTLRSLNFGPTFRTRGGVIGVIAERGRFEQGPYRANRNNYGAFLSKSFGANQLTIAGSNLKYSGAPSLFLYDVSLANTRNARQRYFIATGRRDVYESAQAVVQGITATTYRAGFTYPLARKLDLEGQAVYYRYSDDNSRLALLPSIYYRFRPTNPSLRVGLGYAYDDSRRASNIYYAPQSYSSVSALADYVHDVGRTRFGINGAVALTGSTGAGGVNRPADTLFGFIAHDLSPSLEIFANGGIVRSPDFRSDQVTAGANLWF